jgi:hypothetical protein
MIRGFGDIREISYAKGRKKVRWWVCSPIAPAAAQSRRAACSNPLLRFAARFAAWRGQLLPPGLARWPCPHDPSPPRVPPCHPSTTLLEPRPRRAAHKRKPLSGTMHRWQGGRGSLRATHEPDKAPLKYHVVTRRSYVNMPLLDRLKIRRGRRRERPGLHQYLGQQAWSMRSTVLHNENRSMKPFGQSANKHLQCLDASERGSYYDDVLVRHTYHLYRIG